HKARAEKRETSRRKRGDAGTRPAKLPSPEADRGVRSAARMWTVAALGAALGGVAYRCQDFGRYGFWDDEAWGGVGARVEGGARWCLALSVTPIGWAGLLRALGAAPGPPEFVLRLLPLVASVATL